MISSNWIVPQISQKEMESNNNEEHYSDDQKNIQQYKGISSKIAKKLKNKYPVFYPNQADVQDSISNYIPNVFSNSEPYNKEHLDSILKKLDDFIKKEGSEKIIASILKKMQQENITISPSSQAIGFVISSPIEDDPFYSP